MVQSSLYNLSMKISLRNVTPLSQSELNWMYLMLTEFMKY